MNRLSKILWGLLFIAAGIGYAGSVLDFWSFNLFFNGWWTLFIIIPCLISIVQNGFRTINTGGLIIGILLLLSAQDLIDGTLIGKLIFPIILILIGLIIIFKGGISKTAKEIKIIHERTEKGSVPEYFSIFSSQDLKLSGQHFAGAQLSAVFGGISLDLRDSIIDSDVVIDITAVFGGAEVFVPSNVNVKVSNIPVFGGVSNKATGKGGPTVYINSICIFGGVDIA